MVPTAGLGFKPIHFEEALAAPAAGLWFEVHPENYMAAGGPRLAMLEALRGARPLSLHGVGLSLAGAAEPDRRHLARLKQLVDRFDPFLVSEHLAWSVQDGRYFPDLLPFPRTTEALLTMVRNVDIVQSALGRKILIENPSLYIAMDGHEWSETDFLKQLAKRTGCGLLIDVNNVAVSANNLRLDPYAYLDALPHEAIGEVHLAGHRPDPELGEALLIDSHDAPVAESVWALFDYLVASAGPRPALIERDGNLPPFADLMAERDRAAAILATPRKAAAYA
ncbi:MAG: MNIO family bufferin maturase [Sphingosinicella sp.]|uniref:MNIO family bufferin maturase n=1 Tax=Sphingosinicella sp. TaxID=1917971 RepID=UPI004037E649